jgi:hypothetical protein
VAGPAIPDTGETVMAVTFEIDPLLTEIIPLQFELTFRPVSA